MVLKRLSGLKALNILWLGTVPLPFTGPGELHEALKQIARDEMAKLMPDKGIKCEAFKWRCCESCDAIADADDNDEDGDDSDEDEDGEEDSKKDENYRDNRTTAIESSA